MKTDRELLELAAKAAGYSGFHLDQSGDFYLVTMPPDVDFPTEWNPLDDDGDALRLAVKLGMRFDCDNVARATIALCRPTRSAVEDHKADSCAATRRAIVRAAAAIGEPMR